MKKPSNRILWVERAQVIAMLLVTLHHSLPRGYGGPLWLSNALEAIQYPALACFFLTGALFAGKWRQIGLWAYLKGRFIRLMTPYFCVNLLMLAPRYLAAKALGYRPNLTVGWLAMSFLDPHGQGIAPHLWFLPALFMLSALLPVIDAALSRTVPRRIALAGLFILSVWPVALPTLLCLNELKLYLFWYAAGLALARGDVSRPPLRGRMGLAVGWLGLVVFIATLVVKDAPMAAALQTVGGALALFEISGLSPRDDALTGLFRGKTFVVYVLSMCVQNLVEVVCYAAKLPWFVSLPAMFVAGLAVPLMIGLWNERHPLPKPVRLMLGV